MKDLTQRIESAKAVFEFTPECKQVFVTSDATCFTVKNLAQNHSLNLEDKSIVIIDNELNAALVADTEGVYLKEPMDIYEEDENPDEFEPLKEEKEPARKALTKMRKDELQAECTKLQIVFAEDATNAQLIELIEAKEAEKA